MKLSNHFSLEEFVYSATASKHGISNLPPQAVIESISALIVNLLQPLRNGYGKPLYISSGYRCEKLNQVVGGAPCSQHIRGEAADLKCDSPENLILVLQKLNIDFDQAILYPTFLHLSYKRDGNNRRQIIRK